MINTPKQLFRKEEIDFLPHQLLLWKGADCHYELLDKTQSQF